MLLIYGIAWLILLRARVRAWREGIDASPATGAALDALVVLPLIAVLRVRAEPDRLVRLRAAIPAPGCGGRAARLGRAPGRRSGAGAGGSGRRGWGEASWPRTWRDSSWLPGSPRARRPPRSRRRWGSWRLGGSRPWPRATGSGRACPSRAGSASWACRCAGAPIAIRRTSRVARRSDPLAYALLGGTAESAASRTEAPVARDRARADVARRARRSSTISATRRRSRPARALLGGARGLSLLTPGSGSRPSTRRPGKPTERSPTWRRPSGRPATRLGRRRPAGGALPGHRPAARPRRSPHAATRPSRRPGARGRLRRDDPPPRVHAERPAVRGRRPPRLVSFWSARTAPGTDFLSGSGSATGCAGSGRTWGRLGATIRRRPGSRERWCVRPGLAIPRDLPAGRYARPGQALGARRVGRLAPRPRGWAARPAPTGSR